jgi:hypothetical protein
LLSSVGSLTDARPPIGQMSHLDYRFYLGDIKYQSPAGNFRVYFPGVTSIVLSVVLTLILRLFG